jgi:methanogenic corrinoid protein MtbC1
MSESRQNATWDSGWASPVGDVSLGRKRPFSAHAAPRREVTDRAAQTEGGGETEATRLARAIEAEIIPRLMLAHRTSARCDLGAAPADRAPTPDDAAELARLSIAHDLTLARSFVESLRSDGVGLDDIVLHVLAPAARLLGDLWLRDLCRFTDVTVGLCRLQQLARDLGPDFERPASAMGGGPRIVLAPAPGEQHVFGLIVLEHFLRRDGWDVWAGSKNVDRRLASLLKREWIGAVGLTVSCEDLLEPLKRHVGELREASSNPDLIVLVGGACSTANPDLAARVGADAAPADVHEAIAFLNGHLRPVDGARPR